MRGKGDDEAHGQANQRQHSQEGSDGAKGDGLLDPVSDKAGVVRALLAELKKDKSRVGAVRALGQLVAGEPHAHFRNVALDALFALSFNPSNIPKHTRSRLRRALSSASRRGETSVWTYRRT